MSNPYEIKWHLEGNVRCLPEDELAAVLGIGESIPGPTQERSLRELAYGYLVQAPDVYVAGDPRILDAGDVLMLIEAMEYHGFGSADLQDDDAVWMLWGHLVLHRLQYALTVLTLVARESTGVPMPPCTSGIVAFLRTIPT